jgi:hypothetical protein
MINKFIRMQQLAGLLTEVNIEPKSVWQVAPDNIKKLIWYIISYYIDIEEGNDDKYEYAKDGSLFLTIDFEDLDPAYYPIDDDPLNWNEAGDEPEFHNSRLEALKKLKGRKYLTSSSQKEDGLYTSKTSIDNSSLTVFYSGQGKGFDKNGNLVKFVNEVNIVPASNTKILRAVPSMELYKVKDFPRITKKNDPLHQKNIYNILNIIYMDVYKEEMDDDFEMWADDVNLDLLKLTSLKNVYIYCTGDGYLHIMSNLSEFSEGYRTEEEWGVEEWEEINTKK